MKISHAALWILDRFNGAVNWAGPVVNLSILAAPDWVANEEGDCEGAHHTYFRDHGKELFIGVAAVRFLLSVMGLCALKKVSAQQSSLISKVENEILDAVETTAYCAQIFMAMSLSEAGSIALAGALSVWPLVALCSQRGPRSHYQEQHQGCVQHWHVGLECQYMALTLSTSFVCVAWLLINVFYDTTHDDSDSLIMWSGMATGGLGIGLGVASVFSRPGWEVARFSEGFVNTFYYLFMFATSSLACEKPTAMGEDFSSSGLPLCLLFMALAAVPALRCGYTTAVYLDEHYLLERRQSEGKAEGSDVTPRIWTKVAVQRCCRARQQNQEDYHRIHN